MQDPDDSNEIDSSSSSSEMTAEELQKILDAYRFGGWRYESKDLPRVSTPGWGGRV